MVRRPSRRALLRTLGALLLVAVALTLWGISSAWTAKGRLEAAQRALDGLRDPSTDRSGIETALAAADEELAAARRHLASPGARFVQWLPILGRSVTAERVIADAAHAVVVSGRDALPALEGIGSTGSIDLEAVQRLADALEAGAARAERPLSELAELRTGFTPPAVGQAVAESRALLAGVDTQMRRAADGLAALRGVLGADGERRLLVALQNNAELRGTGGLITTFATGSTRDGRLTIDGFRDVDLAADALDEVRRVPAPDYFAERYGVYLADTTLWRNANMAPHAPTSAAVLAEVAGATLDREPDVVIFLDVPGMAKISTATTPVAIGDGRRLSGDDLIRYLLVEAYDTDDQQERQLRLARAADASFRQIVEQRLSLSVVRVLAEAAAGRHLMVWSADAEEQRLLESAGVAGSVDPRGDDIAMVTVQNLGDRPLAGNKLDYYVDRTLGVDVTVGPESAEVVQTLTLRNGTPTGLDPYVAGEENPRVVRSLVDIAVALDADLAAVTDAGGEPVDVRLFTEDGSRRIVFPTRLRPGETRTWEVRYTVPLPDGRGYRLRVVPQPLARPATLTLTVRPVADESFDVVRGADATPARTVEETGPLTGARTIEVDLYEPGWFSRFWNEPLQL